MQEAIAAANSSGFIDTRTGTLKVLMAPEFYFRGPHGAYELADIVGVGMTKGLVQKLSDIVLGSTWSGWLFVFGTAMGVSTPDTQRWWDRLIPNLEWFPGSKAWRDYYEEVYNVAIVQLGGAGNAKRAEGSRRVVVTEHKSDIDFLKAPALPGLSGGQVRHLEPVEDSGENRETQKRNYDGNCILDIAHLRLGARPPPDVLGPVYLKSALGLGEPLPARHVTAQPALRRDSDGAGWIAPGPNGAFGCPRRLKQKSSSLAGSKAMAIGTSRECPRKSPRTSSGGRRARTTGMREQRLSRTLRTTYRCTLMAAT